MLRVVLVFGRPRLFVLLFSGSRSSAIISDSVSAIINNSTHCNASGRASVSVCASVCVSARISTI